MAKKGKGKVRPPLPPQRAAPRRAGAEPRRPARRGRRRGRARARRGPKVRRLPLSVVLRGARKQPRLPRGSVARASGRSAGSACRGRGRAEQPGAAERSELRAASRALGPGYNVVADASPCSCSRGHRSAVGRVPGVAEAGPDRVPRAPARSVHHRTALRTPWRANAAADTRPDAMAQCCGRMRRRARSSSATRQSTGTSTSSRSRRGAPLPRSPLPECLPSGWAADAAWCLSAAPRAGRWTLART